MILEGHGALFGRLDLRHRHTRAVQAGCQQAETIWFRVRESTVPGYSFVADQARVRPVDSLPSSPIFDLKLRNALRFTLRLSLCYSRRRPQLDGPRKADR